MENGTDSTNLAQALSTLSAGCSRPEKIPSKKKRVLQAFVNGKTFNRFEAERQLNDHVLNTTVSDLTRQGVTINRRRETVPGYAGLPTKVCRYWIAKEHREDAEKALGRMR